jgi:hypothetical protein
MSWPRSLPTGLKAALYRWPDVNNTNQSMLRLEERFPTPYMNNIYEHSAPFGGPTLNAWYLDVDSEVFVNERHPPKEAVEWSPDELNLYLETTFPVGQSWSEGSVLAVLPEVEVPILFKQHSPQVYAAINQHGELGFVNLDLQKHIVPIPFDHEQAKGIKEQALLGGWELEEWDSGDLQRTLSQHRYRIDDGVFDQKTFHFYPGTRCGWCGSSSIRPFFIGEAQCMACHSKLDAIESRDDLNLSDDWV